MVQLRSVVADASSLSSYAIKTQQKGAGFGCLAVSLWHKKWSKQHIIATNQSTSPPMYLMLFLFLHIELLTRAQSPLSILRPDWSTLIGRGPSRLCSDWLDHQHTAQGTIRISCLELCLYGIGIRVNSMHWKNLLKVPWYRTPSGPVCLFPDWFAPWLKGWFITEWIVSQWVPLLSLTELNITVEFL